MILHSYRCHSNHMHDMTSACICWEDIKCGDYVRYYPQKGGDYFIVGIVIETMQTLPGDFTVKLYNVQGSVPGANCVLIEDGDSAA